MTIGYVYQIYDNTNDNVYYGSTIRTLSKRMAAHESKYTLWCAGKGNNVTSFDIIENGDYDISLVEEVEYQNRKELHTRERFYIKNNVCVNKCIPLRTYKEYYHDNKDKIIEKIRKYREDNKETINENNRKLYEDNRETIREKRKEKMTCICGSIFRKLYQKKHDESPKHLNFMKDNSIS